ncbi:MAG: ABC transporter permease, partial [Planctomycetia bacterium]|nr:ABC transporter permease [Planctomycetia bacterium]
PWTDWAAKVRTDHVAALFPPVPFHPDNIGSSGVLSDESISREEYHWMGVDANQRDVLARLLFGSRISLTIGIVAVSINVLIGILLGALAGYYGRKVDLAISRFIEVMICFPTFFLILTIIAVFDSRSIFLIMGALGIVGWPGVARLVRGEFIRQRNLDYVTAAKAVGLRERRIIFRHVLPNCLGPVLVSATFGVAGSILTESGIAFLGLGDVKAPSWGQMLSNGRASQEWHLILAPGFAIFFVVTVFNLLGEGLRDALDPKLRR